MFTLSGGLERERVRGGLRIRWQAEYRGVKLEILSVIVVVAGKPGDMAWRRRISRWFYPRNLVLKTGYFGHGSACQLIPSVVATGLAPRLP